MKFPASWMKYVTDVATAINELEVNIASEGV